ncbi:MAG: type III-B CRISPR-associated protein Cas10/Cmr2 [Leptolyngbyaceae cyanobacterium SL_7_1]|nr:type III-B CRISPR-associated protein Cas10/Cmr2 [Leptolyngbyaceae cyanobacterium SL_7_1]
MTDPTAQPQLTPSIHPQQITLAIAWCLAWGEAQEPQLPLETLHQMRQAILAGNDPPEVVKDYVNQAQTLQTLTDSDFPKKLIELERNYPQLWQQQTRIGLVYGGATKIKQYVFESASLSDIRGASALLDRINLVDIPGFFSHPKGSNTATTWLNDHFSDLHLALIPELLVYFKGGTILAFCPAAYIHDLSNAIEKRYTHETLTANSCAVGDTFRLLEIRFGLLQDPIENTLWFDKLRSDWKDKPILRAYFGLPEPQDKEGKPTNPDLEKALSNRKNFNELVGKLATQFNQRRSGFDAGGDRPSRRYPPMFETHPYLVRDDSDRRSTVVQVPAGQIPGEPKFSEPLARKHRVGQITKRENSSDRWYKNTFDWKFGEFDSWVRKFETFLSEPRRLNLALRYYQSLPNNVHHANVEEARSLREIAAADPQGFVGYIYADGNNMGQYIRDEIKTPAQYEQFSNDIFEATEQSVYQAIAHHLTPYHYTPDSRSNRTNSNSVWIHPFEIITIGGDDVLLIVPANQALAIAQTIGEKFEEILVAKDRYQIKDPSQNPQPPQATSRQIHRYKPTDAPPSQSCLSISSGVLITAVDTPIYYADKLVNQLLKSAKKTAKHLREKGYYGGTVDFLTMKAVTMISSNITAFRNEGLIVRFPERQQELKLYAAPYTLHELGGLLKTAKAVQISGFPRSQLYQIRSLLELGKRTSILNYRYFRMRLKPENQALLQDQFEKAWCSPLDKNNPGTLAPWMTVQVKDKDTKAIYETLWRELVELLPFIDEADEKAQERSPAQTPQEVEQ